jgi:hypothetical protein
MAGDFALDLLVFFGSVFSSGCGGLLNCRFTSLAASVCTEPAEQRGDWRAALEQYRIAAKLEPQDSDFAAGIERLFEKSIP